ncbi:unnamed protein product [Rhizophagus irregularis]|nr:unnamed protein product [Rhizophagus irregularis]
MAAIGYINTIGIDPLDDAGAPPGRVRAIGVLRSCMRNEAARWFYAELTGKNWELSSIRLVAAANGGAGATRQAFRALAIPEVANGIHVVEEQWRRAGERPTNRPVNGLGNHRGPFNTAVQNQPIVLQRILLDQAFMHMRTNFPTVMEERLQI